jgi:hypothetical protein
LWGSIEEIPGVSPTLMNIFENFPNSSIDNTKERKKERKKGR